MDLTQDVPRPRPPRDDLPPTRPDEPQYEGPLGVGWTRRWTVAALLLGSAAAMVTLLWDPAARVEDAYDEGITLFRAGAPSTACYAAFERSPYAEGGEDERTLWVTFCVAPWLIDEDGEVPPGL